MFAVIDPNWGEPKIILETIRETEEAAISAAISLSEHSLYSGATLATVPPRPGSWERMRKFGFRLAAINQIEWNLRG